MSIRRTGDWDKARALLTDAGRRARRAFQIAVRSEAEQLRRDIVRGLDSQSPGGEAFAPLKALTLISRAAAGLRGRRALIARGALRGAIRVIVRAGEVFVGIPDQLRGRNGQNLSKIAAIHEFGAGPFAIRPTPKMRRFLFAALHRSGAASKSSKSSSDTWIIRIPARPFLRPVFDAFRRGVQQRISSKIQQLMGWR